MLTTYRKHLSAFVRHKSISTDPKYKNDVAHAAQWLQEQFEAHNFDTEVVEGYGNPIVLARYQTDPDNPTCLVYGHYDVQPADESEGWNSPPFTLTERDSRLFARGAADNKGQILIHMTTVFDLVDRNELAYNVIFLIEGDEETGSERFPHFIRDYKDKLAADVALISDGELTAGHPTIEAGFRGVLNATVDVTTSNTEMHSGLYGGAVPNAAHELIQLLDPLFGNAYHITIPGFYKHVDDPDEKTKREIEKIPFDMNRFHKLTGTKKLLTENGYDLYTQTGLRPTAQITGIEAGYTGTGYRNSIPPKATAKINFRLTAAQDPDEIADLFANWVQENTPDYVTAKVRAEQKSPGTILNLDNSYTKTARELLEDTYDRDVIITYVGGTLPIAHQLQKLIGLPQLYIPLANEDCGMHAANENISLDLVQKGLAFSRAFFQK